MRQYTASSSLVEINGKTIHSILDAIDDKFTAEYILKKFGFENLEADKWYNQQAFLNAFKEISKYLGDGTLFKIGYAIPNNAQFPTNIKNVHEALYSIDIAYHLNHRNGEIGFYKYKKLGEKYGKMICSNPYPDNFDRGIIMSIIKKYSNKTTGRVIIDQSKLTRSRGGQLTTFIISW